MIEALLELHSAPPDRVSAFTCATCPQKVKALRRCAEDRTDFTEKDGNFWPIQIQKGGALFGFCPAKATWDAGVASLFRALILADRTGANWVSGGISEQPTWWVELASEFLPRLEETRFYARARAIMGDGTKPSTGASNGSHKARSRI